VFALVGLSGITAFTVAQRRREMAIRIAVGATNASVLWLCMRDCLRPLIVGLAVGLAFVLVFIPPLVGSFLADWLAGINLRDPLAVTLSTFALIALSALAVLVSARSAIRLDPAVELRSDVSFDH
jgi:putative ABC transport system permease protein